MNISRNLVNSFIFIITLLIGFWLPGQFSDALPLISSSEQKPAVDGHKFSYADLRESQQRNILLIGVDRANQEHPNLRGIWLMMYIPQVPHITFIPIYPGRELISSAIIEQAFSLNEDKTLTDSFTKSLREVAPVWDSYILMDQVALIGIFDTLNISEPEKSSNIFLPIYLIMENLEQDGDWLNSQKEFIGQICQSNIDPVTNGKLHEYLTNFDDHVKSDMNLTRLYKLVQFWHSSNQNRTCEFLIL